jgi:hypothetical protein
MNTGVHPPGSVRREALAQRAMPTATAHSGARPKMQV